MMMMMMIRGVYPPTTKALLPLNSPFSLPSPSRLRNDLLCWVGLKLYSLTPFPILFFLSIPLPYSFPPFPSCHFADPLKPARGSGGAL